MAKSSRGYYEVASARFLDVVCLIAESKLRTKCRDELIHVINDKLRVNSGYPEACCGFPTTNTILGLERCIELMAEDPERQTRRIALTKERAKLSQAQEWLASVNQPATDDDELMVSEGTMDNEEDWPTGDS